MWTKPEMHIRLIMAIIYLTGTLSSDVINTTVTATVTMINKEDGMRENSAENIPVSGNGSSAGSSGASEVIAVTFKNETLSERTVSESDRCPDSVECEGNAMVNASFAPKALPFDHSDCLDLGIRETAGFAAIAFLAFSVFGYVGFVLWRRYLQNKYGNGQTLITEDVYDISDLRHFEI